MMVQKAEETECDVPGGQIAVGDMDGTGEGAGKVGRLVGMVVGR